MSTSRDIKYWTAVQLALGVQPAAWFLKKGVLVKETEKVVRSYGSAGRRVDLLVLAFSVRRMNDA
jgi:hypothetical protein